MATMTELMKWFSVPEKPVSIGEFREFWGECSKEEKEDYLQQLEEIKITS